MKQPAGLLRILTVSKLFRVFLEQIELYTSKPALLYVSGAGFLIYNNTDYDKKIPRGCRVIPGRREGS